MKFVLQSARFGYVQHVVEGLVIYNKRRTEDMMEFDNDKQVCSFLESNINNGVRFPNDLDIARVN